MRQLPTLWCVYHDRARFLGLLEDPGQGSGFDSAVTHNYDGRFADVADPEKQFFSDSAKAADAV